MPALRRRIAVEGHKRATAPGGHAWLPLNSMGDIMGNTGNAAVHREPWNKRKIVAQKAPFKLKDI